MDELTNQSEAMPQEQEQTQEFTQETTQENTTQQVETPQSIRVKYNHQELELPYDEAVTHIQKGMNYEKAVERARQEARDTWIADQGYEWKGKRITTEAEYKAALQESELEQRIRSQYANVPDEIVNEIIEGKQFREQYQTQQQQIEEQKRQAQAEQELVSRRDSMYDEFLTEFPDYDSPEKWQAIPKEVWADAEKWLKTGGREGRRLADGLTRHNFRTNQAQQQAEQANQANAASSTGSVKAQAPPKGPLTQEMVENMTDKERMARWPEIRKLYNMK